MHPHFKKSGTQLIAKPSAELTHDDAKDLQYILKLAFQDIDALRDGKTPTVGDECLTFSHLDMIMHECKDDDLRKLMQAKFAAVLGLKGETK